MVGTVGSRGSIPLPTTNQLNINVMNYKWIKWTNEEHILCTNEFEPLKTKVASVNLTSKYYNTWSIWINKFSWNNQPLQSEEVIGLRDAKKITLNFLLTN